jgi:hypothetical protein
MCSDTYLKSKTFIIIIKYSPSRNDDNVDMIVNIDTQREVS